MEKLKRFLKTSVLIVAMVLLAEADIIANEIGHDYENIAFEIKELADAMSKGILNKDKIYEICGNTLDENSRKKFYECGNLETVSYKLRISYSTDDKEAKKLQPTWIDLYFHKIDGFPVSWLLKIFGKWHYFDKRVKVPHLSFLYFDEKSSKYKINISGKEIIGPPNAESIKDCKVKIIILRIL